jgi:photosystem II stability/assembly factor-like uncharacterized protein
MDELERAGRALRDAVATVNEPDDRVRARARTIVRHRRMFAVAAVATAVIATTVGIGVAANGGSGVGIHTIAPAGSSTTHTLVTTHVVPKGTTVPLHVEAAPGLVAVTGLPTLVAVDSQHLWRVEPVHEESVEYSSDGGRSWDTRLTVPGAGDQPQTVQGIIAFDRQNVITLAFEGNTPDGAPLPMFLARTTDGTHWKRMALHGLPAQLVAISFVDPVDGWGVTTRGDVVTTADAGDHWKATGRPGPTAFTVCLGSRGRGWAATGTTVYRSVDNGATWVAQLTIPAGGGSDVSLVCRGDRAAYASYSVGANQYIGGFLRTDDGGAHWRPLTEDLVLGGTTVTAPGFPANQFRGTPIVMTADATLVFSTGCEVCNSSQNWVVLASPNDRFTVGHFDSTTQQLAFVGATASDSKHAYAEIRQVDPSSPSGGVVNLYASSDGGRTWQLRSTDP